MPTHAHEAAAIQSSSHRASERCRRCGNLPSRYGCEGAACAGIIPVNGGCSPLECLTASQEIRYRMLAAAGWNANRALRLPAQTIAEISENATAREERDPLWLASHPEENPGRLAWAARRCILARAGIKPIATTGADCGPPSRSPKYRRGAS